MKNSLVFYSFVAGILLSGFALQFGTYAQKTPSNDLAGPNNIAASDAGNLKRTVSAGSSFSRAATENRRLRNSLNWTFGGRRQTGWDLYTLLIGQTIGTDALPESAEFAHALSVWQSQNSLAPTGILEDSTLQALIRKWQSQRLGRSIYPSPDHLVAAPIREFYDPTRDADLLKLERATYSAYKRMIAEAAKDKALGLKLTSGGELAEDEKFLRIVSAFRSREYQDKLRKQQPNAGRGTLAKHSPHFTGQALDLYVGGEPVTSKDANRSIQVKTPAYRWLVKNAHRFGFYPYFYEPWHWEYVPGK